MANKSDIEDEKEEEDEDQEDTGYGDDDAGEFTGA